MSGDKDNAKYRLVGVIEHCRRTLIGGHFVAYVRESRIVSEQETSSSSSSWFRANDNSIREVSLDEVLKCEAFLLFYEKAAKTIVFHNADLKEELDENSRGCVYHGKLSVDVFVLVRACGMCLLAGPRCIF